MADKPTVLAVAIYPSKELAEQDFDVVWGAHHEGQFDHVAAAVLRKGADGKLSMDRHDTTAKHVAWGGALIGGALAVVAAPLAIVPLSTVATQGAAWAGVGGIVGHFWHNIPKDELRQMTDLLDRGESALVVVAVNPGGEDIGPLLEHATEKVVAQTTSGDVEAAYESALQQVSSAAVG